MLPIINNQRKVVKFPITGKEYEIRPYLVGEEKALLIAAESKNEDDIRNAVSNLIKSCVTNEKLEISNLSSIEMEFLFLEIRKISSDEVVQIGLKHKCEEVNTIEVNLNAIKVTEMIDPVIVLDEEKQVGVKMRIPTIDMIEKSKGKTNFEQGLNLVINSIESIFTKDEVYKTSDITKEELDNWVNHLNEKQLRKMIEFVEKFPQLFLDVEYTCKKCQEKVQTRISGLSNFLASA